MKHTRKLLSFIITICIAVSMLTGFSPVSAVTETQNTYIIDSAEAEQQPDQSVSQGESIIKIVSEDTSKRGAFEKHFICEDGSYIAATYPYAVHEKDENDEWIDIDNSLALEYNGNRIKNNSKALPISFAQTAASSDQIADMEIDGHKISWSLTATSRLTASDAEALKQLGTDILYREAQSTASLSAYSSAAVQSPIAQEYAHTLNPNAVAQIEAEKEVSAPRTVEELNQEKMTPANLTSTLAYKNAVGEGIDIKYTVLPDKIKEDIILNQPSGFTGYTMHINANGLTAVKREDNSVDFTDEDGEVIFTVYAPYMYDSADELSQDITVELSLQGDTYALTVTPDADWLNSPDRAYPITIDPDISTDRTRTNIVDNYVMQGEGVQDRNLDRLYIGLKSGKIVRTFLKYKTMPTIPEGTTIYSATQRLNLVISTKTANNATAYIVTGGDWESSTIEWSNMPTAYLPIASNISHNNKSHYSFNCLPAVSCWYYGNTTGTNANYGFMMAYHDETIDDYNAFYSADCTTASRRPQLTISYTFGSISISNTSVSIEEGKTQTLTATTTPAGRSVTWSTSNSTIATVSSSGVVTGKKAGTAIVTATMVDSEGVTHRANCTVYVIVPNGVYYIISNNSNYFLTTNGRVTGLSNVYHYAQYPDSYHVTLRIRQMWKIYYLGSGRYSIRPMHKLDMGLDVTNGNVDAWHIGTSDTLSTIPDYCEWTISWDSTGYVFKNNGSSGLTMQVENAFMGTSVVASDYSSTPFCQWGLLKISSPPSGVYWYDTNKGDAIRELSTDVRTINCGSTSSATVLGFVPVLYSPSSNNQTFTWSSNNTGIATVSYNSGSISANNPGDVVITATSSYGRQKLQLNILSKSIDPFHYHNIQYMRYVRITGKNWWGFGNNTDFTINIVKSSMYSDDYCIIHDNIYTGYYREIYISDELKNTLNSLEAGYQEHYSFLPILDKTTLQENTAHTSKEESDQLVEKGYFSTNSSEYYGVWAYNYVSELNLYNYWRGVIDTATAAYGVYLTATSFYYSYLSTTSTTSMQVSSSQYSDAASIIDNIDDAMSGMSYNNKTILSADSRNAALAQEGYTDPLPYKPQTPVAKYQQTASTRYVRVFTGDGRTGRWLMKYTDIEGLTPSQIQSKFALPSTPTHYCFVDVPAGTDVYIGAVNQSSVDGTLQYELENRIPPSSYGPEIQLP